MIDGSILVGATFKRSTDTFRGFNPADGEAFDLIDQHDDEWAPVGNLGDGLRQ